MTRALQIIPQEDQADGNRHEKEFVTFTIAQQLFAVPVELVCDVTRELKVTKVPLANPEIRGALNLRGRIMLAIDMRCYLGLHAAARPQGSMNLVVEYKNEIFSLAVDSVGEVISLPAAQIEPAPANLTGRWRDLAGGVYKGDNVLMIIVDLRKLLNF